MSSEEGIKGGEKSTVQKEQDTVEKVLKVEKKDKQEKLTAWRSMNDLV